jgi:Ni/Co efflux regulator RcnB
MPLIARIVSVAALLACTLQLALVDPAFADDHPGKGKGKGNAHSQESSVSQDRDAGLSVNINFGEPDRQVIRDYYGDVARSGHCPPGLAKKNNGCMPPGQAKKWQVGRPLPRDVVYYELPHELSVRLAVPPAGYRYVRVAADVLMIAAGTGMVAGAVEDLAR